MNAIGNWIKILSENTYILFLRIFGLKTIQVQIKSKPNFKINIYYFVDTIWIKYIIQINYLDVDGNYWLKLMVSPKLNWIVF